MINRVVAVGRLTKDPLLSRTMSGISTCAFTLAVNRRNQIAGQPDADFINCVAWRKTAENITTYLHKGSLIGIEGRIQTRSYTNQQGQKVYVTEVVCDNVQFLESKQNSQSPQPQQTYPYEQSSVQPYYQQQSAATEAEKGIPWDDVDTLDIASDDLPF
ncbi:single-stranded DNA-binding protein [[Clostridium] innocuum]|nr:single-stranded DNA-binding protein [[Clostridium] innocuum]